MQNIYPINKWFILRIFAKVKNKTKLVLMKLSCDGFPRAEKKTSFFFSIFFLSRTFTNHRTAGEEQGQFFNSSLIISLALWTFIYQPGNYWRELTSATSQRPDSNQEPLASDRKLLTTLLRALKTTPLSLQYLVSTKRSYILK